MTTFDSREKGFENKFALDEELSFKALSRRNYLLGLWAAGKIGTPSAQVDSYAKSLVTLAVGKSQKDAEDAIVTQVLGDFSKAKVEVSEKELRAEMANLLQTAREQILGDAV